MNKLITIFIIICAAYGCKEKNGKNNFNESHMNTQSKEKTFTERPFYQVKVKTSAVGFDIRINDFPVLQYNKKEGGGTQMEIPINPAILSSGKQRLSVKVFPLIGQSLISEEGKFEIEINKKEDAWVYDGKREIIMPNVEMKLTKNIPLWEYSFDFEAQVPYSFAAWSTSKDLSKIDNLDMLLNNAYNEVAKAIESKDNDKFIKLVAKTSQVDIMLYEKETEMQGFQLEPEKILPIDNCFIKLYGNNRLVRYETIELESCFKSEVNYGKNEKEVYTYSIFFYMPQDSEELEVIR